MDNRRFFRAGNLLKIYFVISWFFFSSHTYSYIKKTFPSEQLEQASYAVWELWAINVFAPSLPLPDITQTESNSYKLQTGLKRWSVFLGSGFFIAPEDPEQKDSNLLLTNCHSVRKLLENGKSLKDLLIYNYFHLDLKEKRGPLEIDDLIAVDCIAGLALLKTKDKIPSYLTMSESPLNDKETLFVLDRIEDSTHLIKQIGQAHPTSNHLYFPANYSYLRNSIGSPVTNIQGQVTGMVSDTTANMILSVNTNQLKSFIEGDTGVHCDKKDAWDCLNEAMDLLHKHTEPDPLPDSISFLHTYPQNKKTVDLTTIELWAERGYTPAQHALALKCYNEQNIPCALHWALQAKKHGYLPAKNILSYLNQIENMVADADIHNMNIHKVSRQD